MNAAFATAKLANACAKRSGPAPTAKSPSALHPTATATGTARLNRKSVLAHPASLEISVNLKFAPKNVETGESVKKENASAQNSGKESYAKKWPNRK